MSAEKTMNEIPSCDELAAAIETAQWQWLRIHLERGGLIVVAPGLDLAMVAFGITTNDTESVNEWITDGYLTKPDPVQIFDWDAAPETGFRFLITSPYVLIQQEEHLIH